MAKHKNSYESAHTVEVFASALTSSHVADFPSVDMDAPLLRDLLNCTLEMRLQVIEHIICSG